MSQTNTTLEHANETIIMKVKKNAKDKTLMLALGGFGLVFAGFLCLTIIGILPGIGVGILSMGAIYAGLGKQPVSCPHCKKKQHVLQVAENFKCSKCQRMTIVEWTS